MQLGTGSYILLSDTLSIMTDDYEEERKTFKCDQETCKKTKYNQWRKTALLGTPNTKMPFYILIHDVMLDFNPTM